MLQYESSLDAMQDAVLFPIERSLHMVSFKAMKIVPANYIISTARARGELQPGGTVVETSSGNFALGMAIVCNRLNHPFVAIGDPVIDPTFKRQLEMLGGRVEIVTDKRAARGTRRRDSIDCTKFSMPSKGRSGAASTTTRTTRSLTPTSPTSCWTGSAPPDSRRAGRLRRLELRHGDVAARGRRRLHARRRRHLQQRPVRSTARANCVVSATRSCPET